MPSWSVEAIIALITLMATCAPVSLFLWRRIRHRREATQPGGNATIEHLISQAHTYIKYSDIEPGSHVSSSQQGFLVNEEVFAYARTTSIMQT